MHRGWPQRTEDKRQTSPLRPSLTFEPSPQTLWPSRSTESTAAPSNSNPSTNSQCQWLPPKTWRVATPLNASRTLSINSLSRVKRPKTRCAKSSPIILKILRYNKPHRRPKNPPVRTKSSQSKKKLKWPKLKRVFKKSRLKILICMKAAFWTK